MVNVPLVPGSSVDGDANTLPRSRTWPSVPYHVRATATLRAVVEPAFRTVPCSVTVPSPFVVRVSDVTDSDRADGSAPAVTEKLTLAKAGTVPVRANGVTAPSP